MSLAKSVIFDGALQRQMAAGDILAGGEVVPATDAGTTKTVTGANLLAGIILRSGAAAMTDTLDSAANIVAALVGAVNAPNGVQPGTTFRVRWITSTANAITVQATANTGVTVNRGTVAASTSRDFLVTVANGTPAQSFGVLTTSGSAVLTGFTAAQLALLTVGMVVTNAVANLQGTTIISINFAAGSVTMSGNANATNTTPVAISFSPVIVVDGL